MAITGITVDLDPNFNFEDLMNWQQGDPMPPALGTVIVAHNSGDQVFPNDLNINLTSNPTIPEAFPGLDFLGYDPAPANNTDTQTGFSLLLTPNAILSLQQYFLDNPNASVDWTVIAQAGSVSPSIDTITIEQTPATIEPTITDTLDGTVNDPDSSDNIVVEYNLDNISGGTTIAQWVIEDEDDADGVITLTDLFANGNDFFQLHDPTGEFSFSSSNLSVSIDAFGLFSMSILQDGIDEINTYLANNNLDEITLFAKIEYTDAEGNTVQEETNLKFLAAPVVDAPATITDNLDGTVDNIGTGNPVEYDAVDLSNGDVIASWTFFDEDGDISVADFYDNAEFDIVDSDGNSFPGSGYNFSFNNSVLNYTLNDTGITVINDMLESANGQPVELIATVSYLDEGGNTIQESTILRFNPLVTADSAAIITDAKDGTTSSTNSPDDGADQVYTIDPNVDYLQSDFVTETILEWSVADDGNINFDFSANGNSSLSISGSGLTLIEGSDYNLIADSSQSKVFVKLLGAGYDKIDQGLANGTVSLTATFSFTDTGGNLTVEDTDLVFNAPATNEAAVIVDEEDGTASNTNEAPDSPVYNIDGNLTYLESEFASNSTILEWTITDIDGDVEFDLSSGGNTNITFSGIDLTEGADYTIIPSDSQGKVYVKLLGEGYDKIVAQVGSGSSTITANISFTDTDGNVTTESTSLTFNGVPIGDAAIITDIKDGSSSNTGTAGIEQVYEVVEGVSFLDSEFNNLTIAEWSITDIDGDVAFDLSSGGNTSVSFSGINLVAGDYQITPSDAQGKVYVELLSSGYDKIADALANGVSNMTVSITFTDTGGNVSTESTSFAFNLVDPAVASIITDSLDNSSNQTDVITSTALEVDFADLKAEAILSTGYKIGEFTISDQSGNGDVVEIDTNLVSITVDFNGTELVSGTHFEIEINDDDPNNVVYVIKLNSDGADLIDLNIDVDQTLNLNVNISYTDPEGLTTVEQTIHAVTQTLINAEIEDLKDNTVSDSETPEIVDDVSYFIMPLGNMIEGIQFGNFDIAKWKITDVDGDVAFDSTPDTGNLVYSLVDDSGSSTFNPGVDYIIVSDDSNGEVAFQFLQPGYDKIVAATANGDAVNLTANIEFTDSDGNVTTEQTGLSFTDPLAGDSPAIISDAKDDTQSSDDTPEDGDVQALDITAVEEGLSIGEYTITDGLNAVDVSQIEITISNADGSFALSNEAPNDDFEVVSTVAPLTTVINISLKENGVTAIQNYIQSLIGAGETPELNFDVVISYNDGTNITVEKTSFNIFGDSASTGEGATIVDLLDGTENSDTVAEAGDLVTYSPDDLQFNPPSTLAHWTITDGADAIETDLFTAKTLVNTDTGEEWVENVDFVFANEIDGIRFKLLQGGKDKIDAATASNEVLNLKATIEYTDADNNRTVEETIIAISDDLSGDNITIVDNLDGTENSDDIVEAGDVYIHDDTELDLNTEFAKWTLTDETGTPLEADNISHILIETTGHIDMSVFLEGSHYVFNKGADGVLTIKLLQDGLDVINDAIVVGDFPNFIAEVSYEDPNDSTHIIKEDTRIGFQNGDSPATISDQIDFSSNTGGTNITPGPIEVIETLEDNLFSGFKLGKFIVIDDSEVDPTGIIIDFDIISTAPPFSLVNGDYTIDYTGIGSNQVTVEIELTAQGRDKIQGYVDQDTNLELKTTIKYTDSNGNITTEETPHLIQHEANGGSPDPDVPVIVKDFNAVLFESDDGYKHYSHAILRPEDLPDSDWDQITTELISVDIYDENGVYLETLSSPDMFGDFDTDPDPDQFAYTNKFINYQVIRLHIYSNKLGSESGDFYDIPAGKDYDFKFNLNVLEDGELIAKQEVYQQIRGFGDSSGGGGSNNVPQILDGDQDSDGVDNNNNTVINLPVNGINADVPIDVFQVEDENPQDIILDTDPSATFLLNNNTGASYDLSTGYFSVNVDDNTGALSISFTQSGIDTLGIGSGSSNSSYTFIMTVIDDVGQKSAPHSVVIFIDSDNGNNGGNGSNNDNEAPVIMDGANDSDSNQANGTTILNLSSGLISPNSSVDSFIIIDENVSDVNIVQSQAYTLLVNNHTGEIYKLNENYYNLELVNGRVEFAFTSNGISQIIDGSTTNLDLTLLFTVEDDQGLKSETHTVRMYIDVPNQGGGGGNDNAVPIIIDDDSNPNDDTTVIDLNSDQIQPNTFLKEWQIDDENPNTVVRDPNGVNSILVDNVTGDDYNLDTSSPLFNISMVNGSLQFSFTQAGINQLINGRSEPNLSFTASFRVIDETGQQSEYHTVLINVANSNGGDNPDNEKPVILDEADDETGVTGDNTSLITLSGNNLTSGEIIAEFAVTDDGPIDQIDILNSGILMVDLTSGDIYTFTNNPSVDYFTVYMENGQVKVALTELGITELGLRQLAGDEVKTYNISLQVSDEGGEASTIHDLILRVNSAELGDENQAPSINEESSTDDGVDDDTSALEIDATEVASFVAEFAVNDDGPIDQIDLVNAGIVMVNSISGDFYTFTDNPDTDMFTVYMDAGTLKFSFTELGITTLGLDNLDSGESKNYLLTLQVTDSEGEMSEVENFSITINGVADDTPNTPPTFEITDPTQTENDQDFIEDGVLIKFQINDNGLVSDVQITTLNLSFFSDGPFGSVELPIDADLFSHVINPDGSGTINLSEEAKNIIADMAEPGETINFELDVTVTDSEGLESVYTDLPAELLGLEPNDAPVLTITESTVYEGDLDNDGTIVTFLVEDENLAELEVSELSITYVIDNPLGDPEVENLVHGTHYNYNIDTNTGVGQIILTQAAIEAFQDIITPDTGDFNMQLSMTVTDEFGMTHNANEVITITAEIPNDDPTIQVVNDEFSETDLPSVLEFQVTDETIETLTVVNSVVKYEFENPLGDNFAILDPQYYDVVINNDTGFGTVVITDQIMIDYIANNVDFGETFEMRVELTISDEHGAIATLPEVPVIINGEFVNEAPIATIEENIFSETNLSTIFEFSVEDENLDTVSISNVVVKYPLHNELNGTTDYVVLSPDNYEVSELVNGVGKIILKDNTSSIIQDLIDEGETYQMNITLTVTDEHGESHTIESPIIITGEHNDDPIDDDDNDTSAPVIAAQSSYNVNYTSIDTSTPIFQFTVSDDSSFNVILSDESFVLGSASVSNPMFHIDVTDNVYSVYLSEMGIAKVGEHLEDNPIGSLDNYPFKVTAIDENGNTSTEIINLNVLNNPAANTPPQIDLIEDSSIMDKLNKSDLHDLVDDNGQVTLASFSVNDLETQADQLIVNVSAVAASDDNEITLVKGLHYTLIGDAEVRELKLTEEGVVELNNEFDQMSSVGEENTVKFTISVSDGVIAPSPMEFNLSLVAEDEIIDPPIDDGPVQPEADSVTADDAEINIPDSPYIPSINIDLDDFTNDSDSHYSDAESTNLSHAIDDVTYIHEDGTEEMIDIDLSDMFSFDDGSGEFVVDTTMIDVEPGKEVKIIIGHSATDTQTDGDSDSGDIVLTIYDDDLI